jgi:hypothetical protein
VEITIYLVLAAATFLFTYLTWSKQADVPWACSLIAAIGWTVMALSLGEISYISPNSVGMTWVDVNVGNSHTVGLTGLIYLFHGIGLIHLLATVNWIMMYKKPGSDI